MVAEGLPLVLDYLFKPSSSGAFLISTLAVALAGEIIPQSIIPLYVLEFGCRCIWVVKITMWLMAPIAFPLAYALRLFKAWRTRGHSDIMDGLLPMNELVEFIRLHEQRERHGGVLADDAGLMVRTLMENHDGTIGQDIRPFAAVMIVCAESLISPTVLGNIKSWAVSYLLVVGDGTIEPTATQQDHVEEDVPRISDFLGVLLVKELVGSDVRRDFDHSKTIGDFPIRQVPIVQSSCSIYRLIALLAEESHSCALVVSPLHGVLDSKAGDITPFLLKHGSVTSENLYPLGIVDYHDLVSRVLFGKLSKTHIPQATDHETARESCDRPTTLQISDTGSDIRRRLAPSLCTIEVDGPGHGTGPVQPRAVSLGGAMPKRRKFEGLSMSTSGCTLRPRRSLFGYFGRKAA